MPQCHHQDSRVEAAAAYLVRGELAVQSGLKCLADHHHRRLGKHKIVGEDKYAKPKYEEILKEQTHHSKTDQREKDNLFLVKQGNFPFPLFLY